jgi:hypothetical protein
MGLLKFQLFIITLTLFVHGVFNFQLSPSRLLKVNSFSSRLSSSQDELNIGEYKDVTFSKVSGVLESDSDISKYRIEATIKSKELNSFLNEYKDEMKKRKVVFPGFRPGKLPPYAMTDVRRYIVSYGLELTIGNLCNLNSLLMCSSSGDQVPFGEDSYYEEILVKDFRGYDFTQQRDAWKEGTDFSFTAEFFARQELSEESAQENENEFVVDSELVQ